MESSRPGASPGSGTRRLPVAPVVFGVVLAVIAVWITVAVATDRDPEDTVEAYLDAVADKDVEAAHALVGRSGYGVPYGDSAAFLTPDAISDDWWVVSVKEIDREYRTKARVEAVIAGPGGTAKGEFVVNEVDDEWLLSDPYMLVRFPASPLSYIRVNDEIVPRRAGTADHETYALFPGTYRFYESVPDVVDTQETDVVAVFPRPDSGGLRDTAVVPARLTAGKDTVERLQTAVREHIDECAGFATPWPANNCPFATDGAIDTPNGIRVTDLHGLTWTVRTYPVASMTDGRTDEFNAGFTLRATEPGAVTLRGSGSDTDDKPVTFTVTCDIDLGALAATVSADGDVTVTPAPQRRQAADRTFNTCRRNA